MRRAIWKGYITFGLVSIPVGLYPAEKTSKAIHFKMIDSRNKSPIHYQRVNDESGKEVPWESIAKAYEFEKGNYVLLKKEELEKIAADNLKLINIEDFIERDEIEFLYFNKPYYLVPDKGGDKGYVLLHEIMEKSGKIGIATIIIRTRQHIAALIAYKNALVLNLLHYAEELQKPEEFELPKLDLKKYRITQKEIDMGKQLLETMTVKWQPEKYRDEYREALMKWINNKLRKEKAPTITMEERHKLPKKDKVVDFIELLKQSVNAKKHKQPAKAIKKRI